VPLSSAHAAIEPGALAPSTLPMSVSAKQPSGCCVTMPMLARARNKRSSDGG